ncbi:MAG TPA: GAF domain-containing protein [Aeromonadales bacterium]|nr:GAF domain-containing protein [Aeromonadales bacterium]
MSHLLLAQWRSMTADESDLLVKSSQLSAFIMQTIEDISWAGFYWKRQGQLVVGAYQGPVACTRIALDKGVCGNCFTTGKVQIVDDVHSFAGHIACDINSASEVVYPLFYDDRCIGVFDIDSYKLARFDETIVKEIELICKDFMLTTDFTLINHW